MKKQLYKIDKLDWLASVRRGKKTQYVYAKDRQDLEMTLMNALQMTGSRPILSELT